MRHIWIVDYDNPVIAAVVQQGGYEGHGLALYKTLDEGGEWALEADLSSDPSIICDGVLASNNDLLLVTSRIGELSPADVEFIKLIYDSTSKEWTIDPLTPVTVVSSNNQRKVSRASISVDSNGVIWCAARVKFAFQGVPGYTQIKVFYSVDGGYTWNGTNDRFGTFNRLDDKCGKVISVGSRTAMIYQDVQGTLPNTVRYKSWAYRENSQPLLDPWTSEGIVQMTSATGDTIGTHWSVAADGAGNLHMTYQDGGISYIKYDAATGRWLDPVVVTTYAGVYNCISVAANNDLYLFSRFKDQQKVYCKRFSPRDQRWSRWLAMSSGPHDGFLRMSSPETVADHLPLVYETESASLYELLYVLFNAAALTVCRQAP